MRTLVLALSLLASLVIAASARSLESLQPVSETTFKSIDHEYEYKFSTLRQQDLWVVVGLRARGQLTGLQQYQIWKLDSKGKKLAEIDLNDISRIFGITTLKNGNIAAVVETKEKQVKILAFDGIGAKPVVNGLVETSLVSLFISKVFSTDDGNLIALGRTRTAGLMLRLNQLGATSERAVFENGDVTVLTDGVELANKTLALLGERLDKDGQIVTWIGKRDINGRLLATHSFTGTSGTLAYDRDAQFFTVIYTSKGTDGWNVSVRTLSDNLEPVGEHILISGLRTAANFRVAPLGNGVNLVVGATAKNRLWIAKINKSAEVLSSLTFEEPEVRWQRIWNYDLVLTPTERVIPFSEVIVGSDAEQRQVFKVLRFR